MGRRKKAAKPKPKKRPVVAKVFKCPLCSHARSVECKLDSSTSIGNLLCRICGGSYQQRIDYLTEPIDLYSSWIDELEELKERDLQENEYGNAEAGDSSSSSDSDSGDDDILQGANSENSGAAAPKLTLKLGKKSAATPEKSSGAGLFSSSSESDSE
eukprot:g4507.t1